MQTMVALSGLQKNDIWYLIQRIHSYLLIGELMEDVNSVIHFLLCTSFETDCWKMHDEQNSIIDGMNQQ